MLHQSKGLDCDVKPLMPLKCTMKHNDEFSVCPSFGTTIENRGINMIDKNRAPVSSSRAREYRFTPDVIRDDYVIGKSARQSFDYLQKSYVRTGRAHAKFIAEQLRREVMKVQENFGASKLWIPPGKYQKVGHVMDMNQFIAVFAIQLSDES